MMVREPRFPFPFLERPGPRRPPTGPAPIRRQPKGRRERHEEFVMAVRALVTVIDDDESVRASLPDLLRAFGFVVRAFSSAEEFLASNCVGQTRCLILDIVMPGMTGPDLQRELALRRQRIPIVFITSYGDETVRPRALEDGAVECLFKPFSEKALLDAVNAPSCLVLDVPLPDFNGLDLQKRVAVDRTDMPIIFITGNGDVPMTVQAMKAGAVEFLTKPFGDDVLVNAIRHAIEFSRAALGQEADIQALRTRYASLTRREREVMALVVSGFLNKQVGDEQGTSEITVKTHRGKVMRK